jgi:ribosome-binding factor A
MYESSLTSCSGPDFPWTEQGQRNVEMKRYRLERVAEVVRETASETILFDLRDPRVKGVTVTRAEVSGDLQHAKVFVSIMGTPQEQNLCMHGLKHAAGFVQSKLAGRLQSRYTPLIQFVLDQGVKKSIEITRLINEALADSGPSAGAAPQAAERQPEEEDTDL